MEKKIKTNAQKFSSEFEMLSTQIVSAFFEGTNAEVNKTNETKDGGYDIIVEYNEGNTLKKIFFECKLRSSNLNLRDIAANIIIAFNEGAVGLGIITNYNYTEQSNENIAEFFQKTFLNIKVIIGEDFPEIINRYKLSISPELRGMIGFKKAIRKEDFQFLRIDWSKKNIYRQFIEKGYSSSLTHNSYIVEVNSTLFDNAKHYLENGEIICIKGLIGVGKTSFIKNLLSEIDAHEIQIIADMYNSQSQLLLGVFLDLWGVPLHNIVHGFTDDLVKKITSSIEINSNSEVSDIIHSLLSNSYLSDIAYENYNWLICNYLIHQIIMHKDNFHYVFYIKNIEYATEEVQNILLYLCKLLNNNKIACIIEKDSLEYEILKSSKVDIFHNGIKKYIREIPLNYLTSIEADNFVKREMQGYPETVQKCILCKAGVRLLTLNAVISYVKQIYQKDMESKISEKLEKFSQNDIPSSVNNLLDYYFEIDPELFYYLAFAQGKLPIEWIKLLDKDNDEITEHLIALKFLDYDDSCLVAANDLVRSKLNDFLCQNPYKVKKAAEKILSIVDNFDDNYYIECKISVYYHLKKYQITYDYINKYMDKLWCDRQFSSYIKYGTMALKILDILNKDAEHQLILLTKLLAAWVVKKQENNLDTELLYERYKELLERAAITTRNEFQIKYDYFISKKFFKNCDFKNAVFITEPYYNKFINDTLDKNKSEWAEKICIVYALGKKELQGNDSALQIFKRLIYKNPNSFFIRFEMLSHQQCMNFFKNPLQALKCSEEMFELFNQNLRDDLPLPYHEYVDRAMCALCAKKYDLALQFSDEAIRILDSNGILPALGRAYNIKGCTKLCQDEMVAAKKYIKDACYIMDEVDYYLFSWRSRLNLILLEIHYPSNHTEYKKIKNMLEKTYAQFKNIYKEKINSLALQEEFYNSREYFALLMFGDAYNMLKMKNKVIEDQMLSGKILKNYKAHLKLLTNNAVSYFTETPYSHKNFIFMIA